MYTAMIILDVLLAISLISLVLLQHGKGADAGAAFGSGSSGTVFGAAGGASVLQKITTWVAIGFFAVTLGLSVLAKDRVDQAVKQVKPTSIVQDIIPEQAAEPDQSRADEIPEVDFKPSGIDAIPFDGGESVPPAAADIPVVEEEVQQVVEEESLQIPAE